MINEDTKNTKSGKTQRRDRGQCSQHVQQVQAVQSVQQVQPALRAPAAQLRLEPQRCDSQDSLRSLQMLLGRGGGDHSGKPYLSEDRSSYGAAPRYRHGARSDSSTTTTNFLRPRMQFTGYQISGYKKYQVVITLKTVNLPLCGSSSPSPHVTGFLTIRGLTNQHPEITTFFDAFAVDHHELGFLSSSWASDSLMSSCRADDQTDLEHWLNFPAFKQLFLGGERGGCCVDGDGDGDGDGGDAPPTLNDVINGTCHFDDYLKQRFIFMRWKEKYLVPEELADGVEGASYDGFYYIVHDQVTGNIQGFYYHQDAEKFQQLELVPCLETASDCSSCGFEMA